MVFVIIGKSYCNVYCFIEYNNIDISHELLIAQYCGRSDSGDRNISVFHYCSNYKSEVNFTSLLLCIGQNMLFLIKIFSLKIVRKASVYKGLSYFCVIITRASILLTIPVAFIIYTKSPCFTNLYC